jgi:hypothetical protein
MEVLLISRIEGFLATTDSCGQITAKKKIPKPPQILKSMLIHEKIAKIQSYITLLTYNFVSEPFWDIRKSFTVTKLTNMALEMIKFGLPIKCLEAVVLAIHLTTGIQGLDRIRNNPHLT